MATPQDPALIAALPLTPNPTPTVAAPLATAGYLGAMGMPPPASEPDAALAAKMLEPITKDDKPFVHIPQSAMDDPAVLGSFAKMEPFLATMGLSVMEAPDGGAVVFDPSKVDPKSLMRGDKLKAPTKPSSDKTPPPDTQETAAPIAGSGGDLTVAAGQRTVNKERAKSMESAPPSQGSTFLSGMMKRAY